MKKRDELLKELLNASRIMCIDKSWPVSEDELITYHRDSFEFGFACGALWKDEQMMKEAKSGTVDSSFQIMLDDGHCVDIDPSMQLNPAFKVNGGERVKIIIIKDE